MKTAPLPIAADRRIIAGTSMTPELRPGDVIHLRAASIEDLCLGDLVVFVPPGTKTVVVHRLIGKRFDRGRKQGFCKGDRCLYPDRPPLSPESVLGVVIRVERDGGAQFLRTRPRRRIARGKAYLSRQNLLPAQIAALFRLHISRPVLRLSAIFRLEEWFLHHLQFYRFRRLGDRQIFHARIFGKPFGEIVLDHRSRCVEKTGIYCVFAMMVSTTGMIQEVEKRFPGIF